MSLIAQLDSQGTVPCATCHAPWSVPVIAQFHAKRELRQEGFAFIDFGDAILLNYCPQCEHPRSIKEVLSCMEAPVQN